MRMNYSFLFVFLCMIHFQNSYSSIFPSFFGTKLSVSSDPPPNILDNQPEFNPYRDNGGTVVGIAGKNFCLIASDTRLSDKYSIHSRNISRIFQVVMLFLLTFDLLKIFSVDFRFRYFIGKWVLVGYHRVNKCS